MNDYSRFILKRSCSLIGTLFMLAFLSGCDSAREGMDSAWRKIDPAGHRRYHRDKYYPHERKIGIRLPD